MKTTLCRLTISVSTLLFLIACDNTSDEEQIAQHIAAMQEAVEMKQFTAIKSHLHEDFIANKRLGAREVKQMLQMYGMQHRNIGVTVISSKTIMDSAFSDRAETTMKAVVTGSSGQLPTDGSVRTVKLSWVKWSGDWLVIAAEW